jgi:hypothetical protein
MGGRRGRGIIVPEVRPCDDKPTGIDLDSRGSPLVRGRAPMSMKRGSASTTSVVPAASFSRVRLSSARAPLSSTMRVHRRTEMKWAREVTLVVRGRGRGPRTGRAPLSLREAWDLVQPHERRFVGAFDDITILRKVGESEGMDRWAVHAPFALVKIASGAAAGRRKAFARGRQSPRSGPRSAESSRSRRTSSTRRPPSAP